MIWNACTMVHFSVIFCPSLVSALVLTLALISVQNESKWWKDTTRRERESNIFLSVCPKLVKCYTRKLFPHLYRPVGDFCFSTIIYIYLNEFFYLFIVFISTVFLHRVLFSSSVLNLCELVALRPDLARLKKVLYFHENQLVYPVRKDQERDFQYGYNQVLSW